MRRGQDWEAPPCADSFEAEAAVTRAADGFAAAATASSIICGPWEIARLTGCSTSGSPAKRSRPEMLTSAAMISALAAAICSSVNGVMPPEPWVSTCSRTPFSFAAFSRDSAAM